MGSCPDSACTAGGVQGCMGAAGQKPSDAGEGPASPYLAKPWSDREPTRVWSGPESACALEDAAGDKGVAGPKPSDAGEEAASPSRAKP